MVLSLRRRESKEKSEESLDEPRKKKSPQGSLTVPPEDMDLFKLATRVEAYCSGTGNPRFGLVSREWWEETQAITLLKRNPKLLAEIIGKSEDIPLSKKGLLEIMPHFHVRNRAARSMAFLLVEDGEHSVLRDFLKAEEQDELWKRLEKLRFQRK